MGELHLDWVFRVGNVLVSDRDQNLSRIHCYPLRGSLETLLCGAGLSKHLLRRYVDPYVCEQYLLQPLWPAERTVRPSVVLKTCKFQPKDVKFDSCSYIQGSMRIHHLKMHSNQGGLDQ